METWLVYREKKNDRTGDSRIDECICDSYFLAIATAQELKKKYPNENINIEQCN